MINAYYERDIHTAEKMHTNNLHISKYLVIKKGGEALPNTDCKVF